MRVITLLNEKGGVGKTTGAIHIAAGRAIRGERVLLIDSDAQGHGATRLGLKEYDGLFRLLIQEASWNDVLRETNPAAWAGSYPVEGRGQLILLPGNVTSRLITQATDDITLLRERLEEVRDYFDLVVIDTSPTPSLLHTMIYAATDAMVYPTQCQYLALEGLGKSLVHITKMNTQRAAMGLSPADVSGVLPTMYDGRTDAHKHGMKKLVDHFGGKVLPALRHLTVWREVEYAQKTIFAGAPGSAAEEDMWGVIDCLAG